jgi:hypothetical protein
MHKAQLKNIISPVVRMAIRDYILPGSEIVAKARALSPVQTPQCRFLRPHFDRRVYDWLQWQQWVVLIAVAQAMDGMQVDEMLEVVRDVEATTITYSKKKVRLIFHLNIH